jgi:hypothetical protein
MFVSSPFSWAVAGSVITAMLALLGIIVRQVIPWRRADAEAEAAFRGELLARENALTARVTKLEHTLNRERLRHNAERGLDRHRLNNITQCFDAILMMLEMNPDRSQEIVKKIKEMRATQMVAEAEEKAAIRAAEIAADDLEGDHDGN